MTDDLGRARIVEAVRQHDSQCRRVVATTNLDDLHTAAVCPFIESALTKALALAEAKGAVVAVRRLPTWLYNSMALEAVRSAAEAEYARCLAALEDSDG